MIKFHYCSANIVAGQSRYKIKEEQRHHRVKNYLCVPKHGQCTVSQKGDVAVIANCNQPQ